MLTNREARLPVEVRSPLQEWNAAAPHVPQRALRREAVVRQQRKRRPIRLRRDHQRCPRERQRQRARQDRLRVLRRRRHPRTQHPRLREQERAHLAPLAPRYERPPRAVRQILRQHGTAIRPEARRVERDHLQQIIAPHLLHPSRDCRIKPRRGHPRELRHPVIHREAHPRVQRIARVARIQQRHRASSLVYPRQHSLHQRPRDPLPLERRQHAHLPYIRERPEVRRAHHPRRLALHLRQQPSIRLQAQQPRQLRAPALPPVCRYADRVRRRNIRLHQRLYLDCRHASLLTIALQTTCPRHLPPRSIFCPLRQPDFVARRSGAISTSHSCYFRAYSMREPGRRQRCACPPVAPRCGGWVGRWAMTQPNPGPLQGQTLGTYYLESLLGVGGMAEVYRARDLVLQRDVAVKVLPRALAEDPNYVTRFRDEARVVAALAHPNIVPVYTFGEERGLLYLVMPIMRQSLRDLLDADGALPPSEAAQFALQVAAGLEAAHALGLVHRDVKPENVMLDADGHALLTDFGIARELATLKRREPRTLAATGLPVGTPEYMAPEQLEGRPLDQRADLYSLGVVLYELLTGSAPFRAETPYSVAAKVLTEQIVPPSALQPALWPEIEAVVMRALSRHPQDRYPDTPTFAAALRQAIFSQGAAVAAGLSGSPARASAAGALAAASALSPVRPVAPPLAPPVQAPAAALASRLLASRLSTRRGALAVAALALALLVAGVGVLVHPGFLFGPGSQDAVLSPTIAPTATPFTLPTSPAATASPISHATANPSPTN